MEANEFRKYLDNKSMAELEALQWFYMGRYKAVVEAVKRKMPEMEALQ